MARTAHSGRAWRTFRPLASRPAVVALLAAALVLGTTAGATADSAARATTGCQHVVVPSYFYSGSGWRRAIGSKPPPGVMFLNVDNGPGSSPLAHFQSLVRRAHAAGISVLGYSSTVYGQRPIAAVEADVRHYKDWYKVNGMMLDLAAATASELPYYRKLARYIRREIPGSAVWLNPGTYPDRRYLSVADVVLVFEGSYASYRQLQVPRWVGHFRPARFADVIYATSGPRLTSAIRLSRADRAGYVYFTNLAGANPYSALPSYWRREAAAVPADCSSSGQS